MKFGVLIVLTWDIPVVYAPRYRRIVEVDEDLWELHLLGGDGVGSGKVGTIISKATSIR